MRKARQLSHFTGVAVAVIVLANAIPTGPISYDISVSADITNPIVFWNQFITELGLEHRVPPPFLSRDYALAHVSMYDALLLSMNQHVEDPAQSAIVAGAASEVLFYLFPADTNSIAATEASQVGSIQGHTKGEITSGSRLGHEVGKKVVAYGKTDGSDAVFSGAIPTGPCKWTGANPIGPMVGFQKTFILTTGAEFQPPPPYPCGSPQDLADVQTVIDAQNALTPDQIIIVHNWADLPPPTIWNNMLNDRIASYNLGMFDAARASAYLNVGMYDAFVSTWYTKYTYWTARPFQRIPDLATVIPTPNFPGYTSGHSTVSAAASLIMGELSPSEKDFFAAQAEEAAISRLWSCIHFPQDNNQGLMVGREIGQKVVDDMRAEPHPFVHPKGKTS